MSGVYLCEVVDKEDLNHSTFSITVLCAGIAKRAYPGQFLHIKCGDGLLLRRPISICSITGDAVTLAIEKKGSGTSWLSRCGCGDRLDILGPLGNGFSLPDGDIIVVGGGLGTPPMLFTAESSKEGVTAVLGFRDLSRVLLVDRFEDVCDSVYLTTEDGSAGMRGTVSGPLEQLLRRGGFDAVMSCGQHAMQHSVAMLCEQYGVACQVSLEERMGCGVGACLVCACATSNGCNEYMSRVCKDGPVFDAREVVWKV